MPQSYVKSHDLARFCMHAEDRRGACHLGRLGFGIDGPVFADGLLHDKGYGIRRHILQNEFLLVHDNPAPPAFISDHGLFQVVRREHTLQVADG